MKMHDGKPMLAAAWRVVSGRFLAAWVVTLCLAGVTAPVLAAGGDSVVISTAIAKKLLIEQLQSRNLVPATSDLSLEDYIYSNAGQERLDPIVGVWLDAEGQMVPDPAWQDTHKAYCKYRARPPLKATQLLRFKMHRPDERGGGKVRYQYTVVAGLMDVSNPDKWYLRRQHRGESTVMQSDNSKFAVMDNPDDDGLLEPMKDAWDGLNPVVTAPLGPCDKIHVEHVSGHTVGKNIKFLVGYQDARSPKLEYHWDFGDGSKSVDGGQSAVHVYAKEGTYTVTVRVEGTVGGRQVAPDTGTVNVVIGDNQLELVFSSRIEQQFPDGHFVQKFQSTVPLAIGAGSVFEGQAPLHSVQMENTYQAQMMRQLKCSLAPRDGVLKVSASLPESTRGAAGVDVTLIMPVDPTRPSLQAVPGVEVTCPPMPGFAAMMKKVLDGMGANWWMAFQIFHKDELQGKGEYGVVDWQPSSDPGVIARKTYRREMRLDSDQTLQETTTLEIRGGSGR